MASIADVFFKALLDTAQLQVDAVKAGDKAGQTMGGRLASTMKRTIGGAAIGAGIASGMATAVQAATEFEDQLRTINTVAGLTDSELDAVGKDILALSRETGKTTEDLTSGFYDLVSAGVPASEAINVLRDSAKFATGALGSTAESVDLVTSVMNAYGLEAKDSTRITDVFAKAVADGKVTAAELGGAIAQIAPIAASAGVSMEEVSAGFALLTAKGVPAAEAATQMRGAINALITPNETLNRIQARTSLNFADIAREKGLAVALEELRKATGGSAEEFGKALGDVRAYGFGLASTGENADDFGKQITETMDVAGLAQEQYDEKSKSALETGKRLLANVHTFAIEVGGPFVSSLGPAVFALNQLGVSFRGLGAAVGGAVGLLSRSGGALVKATSGLRDRLGRVFARGLGFAEGLVDGVRKGFASVGKSAGARLAASRAGILLGRAFSAAAGAVEGIVSGISKGFAALPLNPKVLSTVKLAGGKLGLAFQAAFLLAIVALADMALPIVSKLGKDLGDAIFPKEVRDVQTDIGTWLRELPWPWGPVGAPEWARIGAEVKAGAGSIIDALNAEFGRPVAFEVTDDIQAAMDSGALAVRPKAEAVGDAIEEPIVEGAEGATEGVQTATQAILSALGALRSDLGAAAAAAAGEMFDPILKAAELAETEAALREQRRIIKDKDSTKKQVAEARLRTVELQKQHFIQLSDLTTYGTDAERIARIDAALASSAVAESYRDGTPAQRAAIDEWRAALVAERSKLVGAGEKSGTATGEGYAGGLEDTKPEITAAANKATSGVKGAVKLPARTWGAATGAAYAAGLASQSAAVQRAADQLSRAGRGPLLARSPPGPESPLHDIDKWGANTIAAWIDGLRSQIPAVRKTALAVSGAAAPRLAGLGASINLPTPSTPAPGAAVAGLTASAGRDVYNINVPVEGLVRARDPLEVAGQLRRLADLGVLAPKAERYT